jgi:ectoine hydroxylase
MLTEEDIATYRRDGLLVVPDLFDSAEVAALCAAFERDAMIPGSQRVAEPDGEMVRAVYASHLRQPEYAALIRSPRVLRAARQLLDPEIYVYQFKVNAKPAFGGGGWAWHQDYVAWKITDNIPGPHLVNVVVFLDEVNQFNGPIAFVPGSHRDGLLRSDRSQHRRSDQHLDPDDIALSPAEMGSLVQRHGIVGPTGRAGSTVFFHPETVHGSAANISPFPRRVAILTYNQVRNTPRPVGVPRPEYLVCRDTRPLDVLETDTLLPLGPNGSFMVDDPAKGDTAVVEPADSLI